MRVQQASESFGTVKAIAEGDVDLSVIIVNYNTRDDIDACLLSVFQTKGSLSLEVVVVDNASADDSVAHISDRFPQATVIANAENIGFSKANNQAMRQTHGRYVVLLNPDTVVLPGALEALVAFLDRNADCGVCGPILLDSRGKVAAGLRRPHVGLLLLQLLRVARWSDRPLHGGATDIVSGACFAVRRSVLHDVGELDGDLFWWEDADYCVRVAARGYKIAIVPDSRVVHIGGRSTQTNLAHVLRMQYVSAVRYFWKHRSSREAKKVVALFVVELMVKSAGWGLVAKVVKGSEQAELRSRVYASLVKELWAFRIPQGNARHL